MPVTLPLCPPIIHHCLKDLYRIYPTYLHSDSWPLNGLTISFRRCLCCEFEMLRNDFFFFSLLTAWWIPDGPSCINVKILSIYLDAKLTVCRCSSGRDTEDPQWPESFQTMVNRWERTVIFNARVCCDVDLEVGNLIRIHKPWYGQVIVEINPESCSSSRAIIVSVISSKFCILMPIVAAIDEYKIHRFL
ncbi:hypothetical protein ACOSQ2_000079 [Xanthoceras sorbifolium]